MTPEQLKAHRVRFEQRYAESHMRDVAQIRALRDDYTYVTDLLKAAWQAYLWAIEDADRAQRAAPVSEALRYQWLRSQPNNTDAPRIDVVAWELSDDSVNNGKGLRGDELDAAIDAAMGIAAHLPQQSAPPVEGAYVDLPAAQPVEVQRVGLTNAQVEDLRADANRGYCIEREEYFKAFRDAEQAHGIPPAGEKGGES